jgi:urease accessory protein
MNTVTQTCLVKVIPRHEAARSTAPVDDSVVLGFERRQKARQRVTLQSGRQAGLFLPRGTTLHDGDHLCSESGLRVNVVAAEESVSISMVSDHLQLARIAYHLGNRHVAVQVMEDRLIYLHDHVLDEMVRGLGAQVRAAAQAFEPEEGAYHGGGHHHH